MKMEYFALRNGKRMPMLGLGTWDLRDKICVDTVSSALKIGYRLLDTARMYQNEKEVGLGIQKSGVKREEIFITSKVCSPWDSYEGTKEAIEASLRDLAVDYIDLYLIHEPYPAVQDMYKALKEAYEEGKIRAIGVSNFLPDYYEEFIQNCGELPMLNQMEAHVYFARRDFAEELLRSGTLMQAWAPFTEGRRKIFQEPLLLKIGEAHGKTAAQIALRYLLQLGIAVIPKSAHPERLKENAAVFDFTLSDAEMQEIAALDEGKSLFGWY